MDAEESAQNEKGSDQPRYYVGRGEETFGPYLKEELAQFHAEGQITDGDFVWDEDGQAWISIPSFLAEPVESSVESVAATVLYPCRRHPDRAAAGHCEDCGQLFCASCIEFKTGQLYCQTCASLVKEKIEDPLQDRVVKTLGIFYEQPLYGVGLILILALVLMPSSKSGGAEPTEGIDTVEANRLWKQSHRAMAVSHVLFELNQVERSKRWSELSLASARKVINEKSVSSLIREQALTFQMRLALDHEQYDLLHELLGEVEEKIERALRQGDLTFFKACDAYLHEKNTAGAVQLFKNIVGEDADRSMGVEMMIEVMTNPAARASGENMMRLASSSFTEVEAMYRLGVCYDMEGKKDKAQALWYRIYNTPDAKGENSRWRRLAMKKLDRKADE